MTRSKIAVPPSRRYQQLIVDNPDEGLRHYSSPAWSSAQGGSALLAYPTPSEMRQPLGYKGRKKRSRRRQPKHPQEDQKTIRPTFSGSDRHLLCEMWEIANELRRRLIDQNDEHHIARGHYLSGNELAALLPALKQCWPALRQLPAEAAQAIAQEVCRDFIHLVRTQGDESALERPVRSLRFTHLKFANGQVRLAKFGWRDYPANALRVVLESTGIRVRGGYLRQSADGEWLLTVAFRRLSEERISRDVLTQIVFGGEAGSAAAMADAKRDEEAMPLARQICLFAAARWRDFGEPWGDYTGIITLTELHAMLARDGRRVSRRRLIGALRQAGAEPRRMWLAGRNERGYRAHDLLKLWLWFCKGIDYRDWLAGQETVALADSGGNFG
jgi:hypothetical protein